MKEKGRLRGSGVVINGLKIFRDVLDAFKGKEKFGEGVLPRNYID